MSRSIIYQVVKNKTNIKGFWKDDNGKLYKDNIKQVAYTPEIKQELFASGELAVFYINSSGHAVIENSDGSILILKTKVISHYKHISKALIEKLLKTYGGLTVYKNKRFKDYTLETWQ